MNNTGYSDFNGRLKIRMIFLIEIITIHYYPIKVNFNSKEWNLNFNLTQLENTNSQNTVI